MKRTALTVGVVVALALPAGLAMAKPARTAGPPPPKAHARVGGKTKQVKVGRSTVRTHTRRTSAGGNTSRPLARKNVSQSKGGGSVGVRSPSAGRARVGILQPSSGATGVSLRGKTKGTPAGGRLRL
jgi:hypothetical protein